MTWPFTSTALAAAEAGALGLLIGGNLKALSVKQPWAWAITDLDKRRENRTWKPPRWIIGKTVALHASKNDDQHGYSAIKKITDGIAPPMDLPRGVVVATFKIAGFEDANDLNPFTDDFDKWLFGPYGWILADVQKLPEPIPCRGTLGLWDVPQEILSGIVVT